MYKNRYNSKPVHDELKARAAGCEAIGQESAEEDDDIWHDHVGGSNAAQWGRKPQHTWTASDTYKILQDILIVGDVRNELKTIVKKMDKYLAKSKLDKDEKNRLKKLRKATKEAINKLNNEVLLEASDSSKT